MSEKNSTHETNLVEEQFVAIEGTDSDNKRFEDEASGTEKNSDTNQKSTGNNEIKEKPGKEKSDSEGFGGNDTLKEINLKLGELNGQIQGLDTEFKSKIKYDQHKEKIIDNLHREVQEYKNDLIKQLIRPLVMDIIHVIDDIAKLVNNHKSKPSSELDPLKLIKQMDDISSDLDNVLSRQGIESFSCEQPEFNPRSQRIIKPEETADQSKVRTIAKKIHNGYEWDGKMLRQEMVNVFVYKPGLENPEENKNEEKNHE